MNAWAVHSLAVVLRGRKGREGRISKHCCSANIAVERCCMIANALDFVEMTNVKHTHTHTHTHTQLFYEKASICLSAVKALCKGRLPIVFSTLSFLIFLQQYFPGIFARHHHSYITLRAALCGFVAHGTCRLSMCRACLAPLRFDASHVLPVTPLTFVTSAAGGL